MRAIIYDVAKNKKKIKNRKLAIVMSGGGMRCVYGVGILTALVEKYGLTEPDIMIAASGSCGGAIKYIVGQYKQTIATWLALLSRKHFIFYARKKIIDIDYLVDEIFKKQFLFNFKNSKKAKTLVLFPLTSVTNGKTVYVEPPRNSDVYEYIRAAKAIPMIYGKTVWRGKTEYIEEDFGLSLADFFREAVKRGATDIIVIDSNPEQFRAPIWILYGSARVKKQLGIANAAKRELLRTPYTVPRSVRCITIALTKKLPTGTLERSKFNLRLRFDLGYRDAVNSIELVKLLS